MKTLFILASLVLSLVSQKPVTIKKMVVFEEGAPAKCVILDEPLVIGASAVEYTLDVADPAKGCSIAFYEADPSKEGGIGRAVSFAFAEGSKAKIALNGRGERYDVKARGYYKSLFVDAGYSLSNYYTVNQFNWITSLGLEDDYEYIQVGKKDSVKMCAIQNGVMVSAPTAEIDWKDDNGALLYPDGEPRFRMIYSNGGKSSIHGASLGDKGRYQIHDFYERGGSYVGTCAGAFLGCKESRKGNRYDNPDPKVSNYTYALYPGALIGTSVPINIKTYPSVYTCMNLTPRCKEIGEQFGYHFADTIEQVRHHGGGYVKDEDALAHPGIEILMRYDYTQQKLEDSCSYTDQNRLTYAMHGKGSKLGVRKSVAGKIATFAWKESDASGRACITGSHPEKEPAGSTKHDFIAMMAQYAMEGNGSIAPKAELVRGKAYVDPTGVGDLQYHHFTFVAEKDMKDVKIVLESKSKADLYVAVRSGDYAWLSDADYMLCSSGAKKTLTIPSLPAGTWYISVYCATTVEASVEALVEKKTKIYDYFYYVDKYDVLNGVKYKLTIK